MKRPIQQPQPTRFSFRCPSCLIVLTVASRAAGVSGPCPACKAPIQAPSPVPGAIPFAMLETGAPKPAESSTDPPPAKAAADPSSTPRKRRILADTGINQKDLETRETTQTLKILVMVVLALGVCLAAAWLVIRST